MRTKIMSADEKSGGRKIRKINVRGRKIRGQQIRRTKNPRTDEKCQFSHFELFMLANNTKFTL